METKQVIVIRKDLKMRKGKMIAQGAHASMKVIFDRMYQEPSDLSYTLLPTVEMRDWIEGRFTKVVVGCNSLEELEELYKNALIEGLPSAMITDAGLTEFGGVPTVTALAIGPDQVEKIDKVTKGLKLL